MHDVTPGAPWRFSRLLRAPAEECIRPGMTNPGVRRFHHCGISHTAVRNASLIRLPGGAVTQLGQEMPELAIRYSRVIGPASDLFFNRRQSTDAEINSGRVHRVLDYRTLGPASMAKATCMANASTRTVRPELTGDSLRKPRANGHG
jgi:hypothetical protein